MAATLHERISRMAFRLTDIIGPVPAYYAKLAGEYRWQIVLRGPKPTVLLQDLNLRDWRVEPNPPDLL